MPRRQWRSAVGRGGWCRFDIKTYLQELFSGDFFYFLQSWFFWSPGEGAVQSKITPVFTQGETLRVHMTIADNKF